MGNRAIIKPVGKNIGVYLHWNGGADSVRTFLEYCKLKGHRSFSDSYGMARFCQVVGNFFGGTCSIGIETEVYDSERRVEEWGLDNGLYVVDGWEIIDRVCAPCNSKGCVRIEMLQAIDEAQPENERLGKDFFNTEVVDVSEIKISDKVLIYDALDAVYETRTVVGFGEDEFHNGTNVKGMPFVDRYLNDGRYDLNINNYIRDKEVLRVKC